MSTHTEARHLNALTAKLLKQLETGSTAPDEILDTLTSIKVWADVVTNELVYELRNDAYTWEEIGDLLGVTKQAVQQKFGPSLKA